MGQSKWPHVNRIGHTVVIQILQGLTQAHRNGLVHRDIKPQHLIPSSGLIKVADFGLALNLDGF